MTTSTKPDTMHEILVKYKGHLLGVVTLFDEFRYQIYRDADDGVLSLVGYGPLYAQDADSVEGCVELLKRAYNPDKDTFTVYPPLYDAPDQGESLPLMKSASEIDFLAPSMSTNKPGLPS